MQSKFTFTLFFKCRPNAASCHHPTQKLHTLEVSCNAKFYLHAHLRQLRYGLTWQIRKEGGFCRHISNSVCISQSRLLEGGFGNLVAFAGKKNIKKAARALQEPRCSKEGTPKLKYPLRPQIYIHVSNR